MHIDSLVAIMPDQMKIREIAGILSGETPFAALKPLSRGCYIGLSSPQKRKEYGMTDTTREFILWITTLDLSVCDCYRIIPVGIKDDGTMVSFFCPATPGERAEALSEGRGPEVESERLPPEPMMAPPRAEWGGIPIDVRAL